MSKTILESVIDDIKHLRGKKVTIFSQPQTLKNKLDDLEIDTIKILENLKSYEIDIKDIDILEYIEIESGNSYNWNSPISNDINYTTYKKDDYNYIVKCRVHRFGDVRSNYTDFFYLEFSYSTEFLEVLLESNEYFNIEVDGVTYGILVDVLSDALEVNGLDDSYIGSVCAYDMNDLKNEIRNLVN